MGGRDGEEGRGREAYVITLLLYNYHHHYKTNLNKSSQCPQKGSKVRARIKNTEIILPF